MKKLSLVLMVVGLLALGGQSFAELCTVDAVPAATLLVPYFEVDLDDDNGVDTFFSVNNASAAPALVHIIFWTDWTAPTIDFDLYLTGYDVQTISVRNTFAGNIPITADDPNDQPDDTISPHQGAHSNNPHWDWNLDGPALGFTNCQNFFPFFNNPVIQGTALDRLTNGHTGNPIASLGGQCLGDDHGDNVARGYITLDNVSECSLVLDPGDTDGPYFADGGTGIATNNNQLWGDWFLVDGTNNFAQGETLVHIEAADGFDGGVTAYTYYGRYLGATGVDNREPLGTSWGTRFLNGGVFDQTQLIVWRDSTANNVLPAGEDCGVGPDWFPLNETEVIAWNESEDAVEICFFTGGIISPPDDEDPACFPYETARYNFGDEPLDVPWNFGWAYLNLNLPPDAPTGDVDFPPPDGPLAQSYVSTIHSALGRFSVGLQAVELTNACQDLNPMINGATVNGGVNVIPFF
jgi:hypothetical protein